MIGTCPRAASVVLVAVGWFLVIVPRMAGSRNNGDHTRRFTELAAAVARLKPRTLVLDGKVAVPLPAAPTPLTNALVMTHSHTP